MPKSKYKISKTKQPLKSKRQISEPETDQETIEFVWSTQVSNAWNRMKYQLEHPLEGRIPPIPGIIDCKKDIYISQLVPMYADVLNERWNRKQMELWAQYDETSLEHVVRNFWSPHFLPRRIALPNIVTFDKSDDLIKTTDKKGKKTQEKPDEVKPDKSKQQDKKKKKVANEEKAEKNEPTVVAAEKRNIKVPCMNIFPQLNLTQSLLSLISEPKVDKPVIETSESNIENKKNLKKGTKAVKNKKNK
ncbi:hypothetical protein HELRODRAFT_175704 [Helobdella robusta]|uniref:Uncharacterized protein n=1 Tax=Helobdella robusta TaxID=6412 RepID=T1F9J7_HELRO|nr:hypothetical protein HELRODRAFT_175704 [Helobdella robusta]ESO00715.1 hypothetical protein HELRODRAFT_175704 [Helobdella robusta]